MGGATRHDIYFQALGRRMRILTAGMALAFTIVLASLALVPMSSAHPPVVPLDAPQPAAFCIVVIQPLDGFRAVRITVDEELTPSRKQADFDAADADEDGSVTPEEADAFQRSTTEFWKGGLGMGNESLSLRASGETRPFYTGYREVRPVYGVTWRHLGHGFYEEAVSSHTGEAKDAAATFATFETQQVREYGFQVADDITSVTLYGADEGRLYGLDSNVTVESQAVEEYVIVQAPAGWHIRSVTGQNYTGPFSKQGPAERLDIAGFDTMAPWSIAFSKGSVAEVVPPPPAPPPPPVVLPATATEGLGTTTAKPAPAPAFVAALAVGVAGLLRRQGRGAIP